MIHKACMKENKDNAIIFGLATDGFMYHFWRVDTSFLFYSLSVFNLKIMTLYNSANKFSSFLFYTLFLLSVRIDLNDQVFSKSE